MLIYILFILFVLIYICIYVKINKDIFSPPLLFLLAYIVSVGCALFNVKLWNIEMIPTTFLVLLLGALEFITIGLLVDKRYQKKENLLHEENRKKLEEIDLPWWKLIFTAAFCCIYMILLYRNVMAIASRHGTYHNLAEALDIFKEETSVTLADSLPWWLGQLERIAMLCAYIFLYVFLVNLISQKGKYTKKKSSKTDPLPGTGYLTYGKRISGFRQAPDPSDNCRWSCYCFSALVLSDREKIYFT